MVGRAPMDTAGHLAEVDRHIEDCTRRVADQRRYVAELRAQGRDNSVSTEVLDLLKEVLAALVQHRKLLKCKLAEEALRRKLRF
jgi:pyrroloquinoline quinone (PQQ) biosynthesis protein C